MLDASMTSKEGFEKAEIDGVHLECALQVERIRGKCIFMMAFSHPEHLLTQPTPWVYAPHNPLKSTLDYTDSRACWFSTHRLRQPALFSSFCLKYLIRRGDKYPLAHMLHQQCGLHCRRDGLPWHSRDSAFQLWPKWLQIWNRAAKKLPQGWRQSWSWSPALHAPRRLPCKSLWPLPHELQRHLGERLSVCRWSHSWEDRMVLKMVMWPGRGSRGSGCQRAHSVLENVWVTVPWEKKGHPWKPGESQSCVGKLHV